MPESAFGVEHGEFSKADRSHATPGRVLTGAFAPGFHGAVAGKKGKKLRAAGYEVGGGVAGTLVGLPPLGAGIGTAAAHNKGYYKKQSPGAM